jgi:hypothetical protein
LLGGFESRQAAADMPDEMRAHHSPITPGQNRRALRCFVGIDGILLTQHLMSNIAL